MSQTIQIPPTPPEPQVVVLTHGVRTTNQQQYFLGAFDSEGAAHRYISMRQTYYGTAGNDGAEVFPL